MPIISGVIASSKTGHLQPLAPTIGTASDGGTGTTVLVTYTPAATGPAATSFTATAYISGVSTGITATTTSTTSATVSGLTTGTTYTFTVHATNATGNSPESSASNSVTPAIPINFFSISTFTAAGGETSCTFSSIPSTYKSLQIRGIGRHSGGSSSAPQNVSVSFNGDSGSNYTHHALASQNGIFVSGIASDTAIVLGGAVAGQSTPSNDFCGSIFDVIDYASTTKYKTAKMVTAGEVQSTSYDEIFYGSGAWMSTSAVTSITYTFPYALVAGSTYTLYGVS